VPQRNATQVGDILLCLTVLAAATLEIPRAKINMHVWYTRFDQPPSGQHFAAVAILSVAFQRPRVFPSQIQRVANFGRAQQIEGPLLKVVESCN
jgi:hypothetical protein